MKKFTKSILLTALIVLVLGSVFFAIGAAMGGIDQLNKKGIINIGKGTFNITSFSFKDKSKPSEVSGTLSSELTALPYNKSDIKKLKISTGASEVAIKESADDKVYIACDSTSFNLIHKLENGTLTIENDTHNISVFNFDISSAKIEIQLPKDIDFEDIDLDIAAGELVCMPLCGNDISLDVAAGNAEMDSLKCKKLEANVGAGNLTISLLDASDVELDVGMGNADIELVGTEKDYNFDIDASMGNIEIGGNSSPVLASSKVIDNHADRNIELECGMGNITVTFK